MIAILSFLSPRYAQFIYKYTKILEKENIEYEVIYWNRECVDYKFKSNWIGYNKPVNTFQPFYKKIVNFLGFTNFMYKTLRKRKYDKLIVLTTQTAIPLFPILVTKYSGKYIYDYRDVTYENISIYKKIVNILVKKSYCTAISSEAFLDCFLNKNEDKYIISHNTRDFSIEKVENNKSDKTRIVYWGMIRQLEFNHKICDLFSKDNRVELVYHGAGFHKELQNYCNEKKYENIKFTGAYNLEDIPEFVKNTDFVLNAYENDKQQKPAMTVKYYDSLKYGIPMIVTENSYMSKLAEEKNLGISINWNETENLDELIKRLSKFDYEKYLMNRKKEIDRIIKDDKLFYDKLICFTK